MLTDIPNQLNVHAPFTASVALTGIAIKGVVLEEGVGVMVEGRMQGGKRAS